MTRRPGLSLTEVLVALFIMALGTISLLTLFPLGAIQMGAALKDDRTAQAAAAADSYMRWYWKTNVVEKPTIVDVNNTTSYGTEPFIQALDDPNWGGTSFPKVAPTSADPSYPVFVDPMGWEASAWSAPSSQAWVGTTAGLSPPRRSLAEIIKITKPPPPQPPQPQYAQRVCSLMDGFGFDDKGIPLPNQNEMRELRYNWAWVIQRPSNKDRFSATMTVVVYDKRAFLFTPPNIEKGFTPTAAAVGQTAVSFPRTPPLGVQKGGWIADMTTTSDGVRNANFYRVVSVTDDGSYLNVELQEPLKPDTKAASAPATAPTVAQRTFVVLAGVSEVFVRPSLTGSDN